MNFKKLAMLLVIAVMITGCGKQDNKGEDTPVKTSESQTKEGVQRESIEKKSKNESIPDIKYFDSHSEMQKYVKDLADKYKDVKVDLG